MGQKQQMVVDTIEESDDSDDSDDSDEAEVDCHSMCSTEFHEIADTKRSLATAAVRGNVDEKVIAQHEVQTAATYWQHEMVPVMFEKWLKGFVVIDSFATAVDFEATPSQPQLFRED
jgi:hypothetical protein